MTHTVYLDYAATTPVDRSVLDAMLPFLSDSFGNASSVHRWGQEARRAIDRARDSVAGAIGAESGEVYFTSGGTEADNTALIGVLTAARRERGRDHLVTTTIEHHAVLDCARFAERALGFRVTFVPVDGLGRVDPDAVADAVTDRTALVSVMQANNEIGTLQPIIAIGRRIAGSGAYLHTDAVQSFGQVPVGVDALGVDLMTLSGHKIYGPKGAGRLYVRTGIKWNPFLHGGMQERERRAGTENVAAIVGFGAAVERLQRESESARLTVLRDEFIQAVIRRIPSAVLNGHPTERLPNNVNLSFPGCDGATLLLSLDMHGIAAASGSACASGSIEPSHVLLALGLPDDIVRSAVRFSLGRSTTAADLGYVVDVLSDCVRAARV